MLTLKSSIKLVGLGVVAVYLSGCTGQPSPGDIAQRLKASVVLIKTHDGTNGGHGTGFFVRGKSDVCTVVTAAHVVRGQKEVRVQTARERKPQEVHIFEGGFDLAVLTFQPESAGCPYPALELGDSDGVAELDPVIISGFPGREGGEPKRQIVDSKVSAVDVLSEGYGIGYTGDIYGGMSGGPVVDRFGKVIAVHGISDSRLVKLYNSGENLLPSQERIIRQAQERVERGVLEKTFKWGIPINTYLEYRPALALPDAAGISATFAWFLFGSGAVAGGLLVFFGVKPLMPRAETENRRRREAEANARELQGQVRSLEKELAAAQGQGRQGEAGLQQARGQVRSLEKELGAAQKQLQQERKRRQREEASLQEAQGQVQTLEKELAAVKQQKEAKRQQPEPRQRSARASSGEVELKSAKAVDYTRLRDLLAAQNFREADKETASCMLKAAGQEERGYLNEEEIDNFPCEDLRTIDGLWVKYSDGRFGFSVQKEIYLELGGTINGTSTSAEMAGLEAFGDRVGWMRRKKWLVYDSLTFGVTAPVGHLPYRSLVTSGGCLHFCILALRLVTCRI